MARVRTCLWFESDADQAVRRYVELVPASHIEHVQRSPGPWPGGKAGDTIVIDFTLGEQAFQALNGGSRVLAHEDRAVAARVFAAMTGMVKIDVAALERAAKG